MASSTAFSVRLKPDDYEFLSEMAKLCKMSPAEFARELILDGLRAASDPDAIAKAIEEEKERLLDAVHQLNKTRSAASRR